MKKHLTIIGLFFFSFIAANPLNAEIIKLKNGKSVDGKITKKISNGIKVDVGSEVDFSYFDHQIESIDGQSFESFISGNPPADSNTSAKNSDEKKSNDNDTLIPSEFEPSIDNQNEDEFKENIGKLVATENFDALEEIYRDFYGQRLVFSSGNWKLSTFYKALNKPYDKDSVSGMLQYIETLKHWGIKYPNSIAQLTALSEGYKVLGWAYRGSGLARTVTEDGEKKFLESIQKSILVAEDVLKLEPKDPQIYATLLEASMAGGYSKKDFAQILELSRALEPLFYPTYEAMATALLPRWMGDKGELEAFAAWVADNSNPYGDEIYAHIAISTRRLAKEEFFVNHNFDWQRIKRGFDLLINQFPKSYFLLHRYCWFASYAQDKQLASELFQKIGDHWNEDAKIVWYNRDTFLKWQTWAAQGDKKAQSELHVQTLKNNYKAVAELINNSANINEIDVDGSTPLMTAISHNYTEIASLLIDHNADLTPRDTGGYDAILLAANNGLRKILEKLLAKGADVNSRLEPSMYTPLHWTAAKGFSKIVELLLQQPKIDVTAKTKDMDNALHLASMKGHLDVVQILLNDKRIDVNAQDDTRQAAIHYATAKGYIDIVKTLIDHGADFNLQGWKNYTPLGTAKYYNYKELIDLLTAKGGKEVNKADYDAALARATEYNDTGGKHLAKLEIEQARELYQKAIDEGVDLPQPYYNLCLIAYNSDKNYSEALNLIEKAIARGSDVAIYYYQRGRIYQKLNQEENALKDFQAYVEKDPNSEDTRILKAEFKDL